MTDLTALPKTIGKVKMIATDIDGTLLRSDGSISEETKRAFSRAAEHGIEIVPASGRCFEGIPDCIKKLPGVNYFITTNGADVYNAKGERLFECAMPYKAAAELSGRMIETGATVGAYIDGKGYMEQKSFEALTGIGEIEIQYQYYKKTRKMVESLPEFILNNKKAVHIVTTSFWLVSADVEKQITEMVADYKDLIYVYGGRTNIDVSHKNASKGKGLLQLADRLGIAANETAAFGDSGNDADMIKKAGIGFAMANGDDYAFDAADFIAPANDEDGIAQIINNCFI